jgi:hypothetical protein
MTNRAFSGALGLGVVIACAAVMPGQAMAETTTSCSEPIVRQPFGSFGDYSYYAAVPGESFDNFSATGWALSGGAKIVATTLYDGTYAYALEVPSGAKAVSPATCVNNEYPYLRTMVRSYSGAVKITLAYATSSGWGSTKLVGEVKSSTAAWQPSSKLKVEVGPYTGWHLAQFTLVGTGKSASAQIYNFYIDPRMR